MVRAKSFLPMGRLPEGAAAFHTAINKWIVEGPHYYVHRCGHEGVSEGAEFPIAEVRRGDEDAASGVPRLIEIFAAFEAYPISEITVSDRGEFGERDEDPRKRAKDTIDDLGVALRREFWKRQSQVAPRHAAQARNGAIEQAGVETGERERQFSGRPPQALQYDERGAVLHYVAELRSAAHELEL